MSGRHCPRRPLLAAATAIFPTLGAVLVAGPAAAASPAAAAAVLFVSPGGDDANAGTDPAAPGTDAGARPRPGPDDEPADDRGHPWSSCCRARAEVWDSGPTHGRSLDVHMATLRAKLGAGELIQTVCGVGYRLDTPPARRPSDGDHPIRR